MLSWDSHKSSVLYSADERQLTVWETKGLSMWPKHKLHISLEEGQTVNHISLVQFNVGVENGSGVAVITDCGNVHLQTIHGTTKSYQVFARSVCEVSKFTQNGSLRIALLGFRDSFLRIYDWTFKLLREVQISRIISCGAATCSVISLDVKWEGNQLSVLTGTFGGAIIQLEFAVAVNQIGLLVVAHLNSRIINQFHNLRKCKLNGFPFQFKWKHSCHLRNH